MMSIFNVKSLNEPRAFGLINENRAALERFTTGGEFYDYVAKYAEDVVQQFWLNSGKVQSEIVFPIPVEEIAKYYHFRLCRVQLADQDKMEFNSLGAGMTLSYSQLYERRLLSSDGKNAQEMITGQIYIDESLGQNMQRVAIAHELGRFVLRAEIAVGPLLTSERFLGPFSSYTIEDAAAEEFAYALMLPYALVSQEKQQYEQKHRYNPLSYADWIAHLEDVAMVPQSFAILAYDRFKRCQLARRD